MQSAASGPPVDDNPPAIPVERDLFLMMIRTKGREDISVVGIIANDRAQIVGMDTNALSAILFHVGISGQNASPEW